jgi:hypothetical protein
MPGRRPLFAFVAFLTLPLSACLHISTSAPTPREDKAKVVVKANDAPQPPQAPPPQSPRLEFASLPKAPGTVVQLNKPQQNPNPTTNSDTGIAQKPNPQPVSPPGPIQPAGEPRPFPVESPLLRAVREYTEGRPDRAIEIIRTLDKPNQDFVLAVLPILARGASADLTNDTATIGVLIDQLDSARARLEQRAPLRVENITFCKEVAGFGRYAPRASSEPYKPNSQAQLYLEVKNLGSRPSGAEFITHIHATVEIRDAHGRMVEQIDPEDYRRRVPVVRFDKRLVSHSPLHDFHVLYIFSAPPAPGVYTISAELRDAATGRTVKTQPVQFCVAGP